MTPAERAEASGGGNSGGASKVMGLLRLVEKK
jgi:hypothetical protein